MGSGTKCRNFEPHISMNFAHLVELCRLTHEEMQKQSVRAVDLTLVVRNWLIGRHIVEYEQNGADRAEYGARFLKSLSARLNLLGIKGTGSTNLKLFRQFYLAYREIGQTLSDFSGTLPSIGQTLSGELAAPPRSTRIQPPPSVESTRTDNSAAALAKSVQSLIRRFPLGWSHYVELLTINSPDERRFYEIEAAANQWGVRELRRQITTSLYERLALSRDKEEIRRLATEGQIVEKSADLVKNPLVLEFLGLAERTHYSEDDLESAIIDQLESFLLELGKGFLFEARLEQITHNLETTDPSASRE